MKQLFTNLLLACALAVPMLAQTSTRPTAAAASATQTEQDAKRADIRKLIELTGAANVSAEVMQQIIHPLRDGFPDVPAEFWDNFTKEVRSDELIDLIVPIYDKYYTREEIHDLMAFYQSPVGQKTVKILPKLSAEAISAGQEWGRAVADRAMRRLKQQGYDKSSSVAPADAPEGQ